MTRNRHIDLTCYCVDCRILSPTFNARYLVLGPPGSGKSSLLKAIAGRLYHKGEKDLRGSVTYNGKELYNSKGFYDQPDMNHENSIWTAMLLCILLRKLSIFHFSVSVVMESKSTFDFMRIPLKIEALRRELTIIISWSMLLLRYLILIMSKIASFETMRFVGSVEASVVV
jgi:ABC-type cobalamin/Fe3+-siderophores transport system ATPase subunit